MVDIPGYSIETEIGRGGMASVYLAVQQSVERRVALKVMSPVLLVDASFSARFMREGKIAANLYHRHVVAVHDVGVHADHHYIAMEYLPGGDLASRCSRGMPTGQVLSVAREIAEALDYAHGKGFVHRDVKPENILFRDDESAVLTDFGIARAVNSATQMTRTGAVIGTPQYMSPEQARGRDLDGRSDLYSLGIVLFEMLTGQVPFEGADSVSVGIKHVTEPVPRLPPALSDLQPLLNGFLAKEPKDRYQSGREAVRAIEELERPAPPAPPVEARVHETRVSDPVGLQTSRKPVHVSATPRPDGSLRREPTLGRIEEIDSFDRTVAQPSVVPKPPPRARRRALWPGLLVLLVLASAGAAWWKKPQLLELLGIDSTASLLEAARAAEGRGLWVDSGDQGAAAYYRRVLSRDPDNAEARSGLDRGAVALVGRALEALDGGARAQAAELLNKARSLDRDVRVPERLAAVSVEAEPSSPEPERNPVEDWTKLLAEARERLSESEPAAAAERYARVLVRDPDHREARSGLNEALDALRAQLRSAIEGERFQHADQLLDELNRFAPEPASDLASALEEARAAAQERKRAETQRRNRIAGLLQLGASALAEGRLTQPEEDNALRHYRAVLDLDGDNEAAREGLQTLARRLLARAEQALEADRLDEGERLLEGARELAPGLAGLEAAQGRLELYRGQRQRSVLSPDDREQLAQLLEQARQAELAGDLMSPPVRSAYDRYKAALSLDPDNQDARQGLRSLSTRLVELARDALNGQDLDRAWAYLGDARQTDPQNPMLAPLRGRLATLMREASATAIEEGRLDRAEALLARASDLEPENEELARLQLQLGIARDTGGG